MSLLSVIVPCYNEEESVALFYRELTKNDPFFKEKEIELELLYIDDGSKDGTVREVKKLIEQDPRVHIISFSRNFGKEAAMFAGLEKSRGDYVVMMDVDLQDPPSLLPEMFEYIWQGYDSVATRRVTRKGEPPIRSFFARRFYHLMKKISQTEMMDGARGWMRSFPCGSITVLPRESSAGSVSVPNGWNMKTWNVPRERPSGTSGNCWYIP